MWTPSIQSDCEGTVHSKDVISHCFHLHHFYHLVISRKRTHDKGVSSGAYNGFDGVCFLGKLLIWWHGHSFHVLFPMLHCSVIKSLKKPVGTDRAFFGRTQKCTPRTKCSQELYVCWSVCWAGHPPLPFRNEALSIHTSTFWSASQEAKPNGISQLHSLAHPQGGWGRRLKVKRSIVQSICFCSFLVKTTSPHRESPHNDRSGVPMSG